jgi:hypothetical protein
MDVEGYDLSTYGTEEPEPLGNWSRWARIRCLWGKGPEQKLVGLVGHALWGGPHYTAKLSLAPTGKPLLLAH